MVTHKAKKHITGTQPPYFTKNFGIGISLLRLALHQFYFLFYSSPCVANCFCYYPNIASIEWAWLSLKCWQHSKNYYQNFQLVHYRFISVLIKKLQQDWKKYYADTENKKNSNKNFSLPSISHITLYSCKFDYENLLN